MKIQLLACVLALAPLLPQDEAPQEPQEPARPVQGAGAPTLRLNNHLGQAVSIGGESDTWTLLAFYPKAMTPG